LPNETFEHVKEFLARKGPFGLPYWGWGLAGGATIAAVVWLHNNPGALSGLTSPSTAAGAGSDSGIGGGSGGATGTDTGTSPAPASAGGGGQPGDIGPGPTGGGVTGGGGGGTTGGAAAQSHTGVATLPNVGQQNGATGNQIAPTTGNIMPSPNLATRAPIGGANASTVGRNVGSWNQGPVPGGQTSGAGPVGQDVMPLPPPMKPVSGAGTAGVVPRGAQAPPPAMKPVSGKGTAGTVPRGYVPPTPVPTSQMNQAPPAYRAPTSGGKRGGPQEG
jgi:hypothetical protein